MMKQTIDTYVTQVAEAAQYIRTHIKQPGFSPLVALVLGSGLGKLAELVEPVCRLPYTSIPYFPQTTVPGHDGTLIAGYLEGMPLLGFKGRKHFYEIAHQPRAMDQVVFPVHVATSLGCKTYVATNAAGGLNPEFKVADLMLIRSHIGFFLPNPLLGPHHDFGNNLYFQPLPDIYPKKLRSLFKSGAPDTKEGVYVGWTGRTFETQAESLMLRNLGADAVGMSTIPEMIIAHNRGMETLGISIITNIIAQDGTNTTTHEEVTSILNNPNTEKKLLESFKKFFRALKSTY